MGKTLLDDDKQFRKDRPIARGCLDYFPDALAEVANVSRVANAQHNGDKPMHWAFGASMDHADCILRHLLDRGTVDVGDGLRHTAKMAWRALAELQTELEKEFPELHKHRQAQRDRAAGKTTHAGAVLESPANKKQPIGSGRVVAVGDLCDYASVKSTPKSLWGEARYQWSPRRPLNGEYTWNDLLHINFSGDVVTARGTRWAPDPDVEKTAQADYIYRRVA